MDAETGVDAAMTFGEVERLSRARERRRHSYHPLDPCRLRPGEHLGRVVAEVRVCVDHAPPAPILLSSSEATASSSLRKSGLGSRSFWPGSSELGSHRPTDAEKSAV